MLSWSLAWKLFVRDWKSGELRVLFFSLWTAIGCLTSVTLLVDRVDRGMTKEAAQVLGADRVISSPKKLEPLFVEKAKQLGLRTSETLRFSSVVVAGDEFHLATVKATDAFFPLAGTMEIGDKPFEPGQKTVGAPKQGEVWVSPRLQQLLKVRLEDEIQVGVARFKLTGLVILEPGGSGFFDFSPTIFMSLEDVEKTEIVQPGSRLRYLLDLAGDEKALTAYSVWAKQRLNKTQRLFGAEEGAPQLGSALGRAKSYLNLSGILGLLLGGIAIAIAANRYAIRHFDHSALLRCMGMKKNQVVRVFTLVLLFAGIAGSLSGIITGIIVNELLVKALAELLPENVPPIQIHTLFVSFLMGLTVLLGFALPALLRIRSVVPMRVLRRDLEPMSLSHWTTIAVAVLCLSAVVYWYAQDLTLVVAMILGGGLLVAISLIVALMLLKLARAIASNHSVAMKFGVEHLQRHKSASLIQISAFGLTLTLIFTVLLIRNEIIADWQAQLPEKAPNHFMINILPEEVAPLNALFDRNQVKAADIYPMVRGRITAFNGKEPSSFLAEEAQNHNSLRRDLNLTWANELPESNKLLSGEWNMQAADAPVISLEKEMANALGLKLGDTMTFNIGGDEITAPISSIRSVQWDSFQPNFYVIFNDGALKDLPSTYITSFFLEPGRKFFLNEIVRQFPTVSVIELDLILNEVRKVLEKATLAVEVVLVFIVFAGIAVLLATTIASLDEKTYESAVLKTLGANKAFVRRATLVEYWVLGLLAGAMAATASEGLAFLLYEYVFKMAPEWHIWIWLAAPIAGLLMVVPAGMLGNRKVLSQPPAAVLGARH